MTTDSGYLEPGTLLSTAIAKTEHALACGALQPIATDYEYIEQNSIRFVVRILANLQRKSTAKAKQSQNKTNPFLPHDPDLFVANLSPTHLCLLNKYNAVDHHLLIITRQFAFQDDWLTCADFEALWLSLQEIDGLGFYNGGSLAGSSQPHKHIQLVPLPLSPDGNRLPIEQAVNNALFQEEIGTIAEFNFSHALVRLADIPSLNCPQAGLTLFNRYQMLLNAVDLPLVGSQQTGAYNLLVTRDWMLLVLRSQDRYRTIPVNALGFAGTLLVKNAEQLVILKEITPIKLLEAVSEPTKQFISDGINIDASIF